VDKSVDENLEPVEKTLARQLSGRLIISVLLVKSRKCKVLRAIDAFC
jgi:hypothetical protein